MMRSRALGLVLVLVALAGCGVARDRTVQLRYGPDAQIEKLPRGAAVTVFRFADVRGKEGDGDVRRVGGIYNAYGTRLARVVSPDPWPDALAQHIASGFAQRGVDSIAVPDRQYAPGSTEVSTPLVLTGEIHNFSTELRWVSYQAHVSGIVRLYDRQGTLRLEKSIGAKARGDEYGNPWFEYGQDPMANLLNAALERFVRAVVTDKDLTALLDAR